MLAIDLWFLVKADVCHGIHSLVEETTLEMHDHNVSKHGVA